ncbi:hypothetical protein PBRA_006574 [Plasmodiophora brassicae]|uniref:Palmitoyltransferase n=1 Tax=Plasmodiophora brassicae TaxID=37360 RepID=A0A0G4IT68_PLABS|nr:hypothetical protein PBRA_006574 [Plasmodiophora brassicae]
MPRQHGLDGAPDALQILSYAVFAVLVLSFALLIGPALPAAAMPGVAGAYVVVTACLVLSAAMATRISTTDPSVVNRSVPRHAMTTTMIQERQRASQDAPDCRWCPYCVWPVHISSKHCRSCDKCTLQFDHHCRWINNDVGGPNYQAFIAQLVSAAAQTALHSTLGVYVLASGPSPSSHATQPVLIPILTGASTAIAAIVLILILHLIALHIFLARLRMTTYEYIVQRRSYSSGNAHQHESLLCPCRVATRVYNHPEPPAQPQAQTAPEPYQTGNGAAESVGP